jgi:hypothetical protein
MTTNVLIAFYSTYGHVHRMALGCEQLADRHKTVAVLPTVADVASK